MSLASKRCVPCRGGETPLTAARVHELLPEVPGWSLDGQKIGREFTFADFAEALVFVNRVGEVAEAEDHHPDIHIHWNRVRLELWTHTVGGLHENDFIVAAKINRL